MKDNRNHKMKAETAPDKNTTDPFKHLESHCDCYPNMSNVASAGECTGLMYAPPQDQEEFESYQELSGMEIPKASGKEE